MADLHLGVVPRGLTERSRDFDRALDRVLGLAQTGDYDLVVLAGDLFDSESILPEDFAALDWFLSTLSLAGIPVVAVEGNHDTIRKDRVRRAGTRWIDLFPRVVSEDRSLAGPDGVPATIELERPGKGILRVCPIDWRPRAEIREILAAMPSGHCDLLVLHQSMEGAVARIGNPEIEFPMLEGKCLYAALGDIHLYRTWSSSETRTVAAYPGPLEWIRSNEATEMGALSVEIDTDSERVVIERIRYPVRGRVVLDVHPGTVVDAVTASRGVLEFGDSRSSHRVGGTSNHCTVVLGDSIRLEEQCSAVWFELRYPHTLDRSGKDAAESVAVLLREVCSRHEVDAIVQLSRLPTVDRQSDYLEASVATAAEEAGSGAVTMAQALEEIAEDDSEETRRVTEACLDLWGSPGSVAEVINRSLGLVGRDEGESPKTDQE